MKKRNLLIGGLLVLSFTASVFVFVACSNEVPEEEVPEITETIRYTEKTNPYAELTWDQYATIDDWDDKEINSPVYYQFEGSYSEAYQGNYRRDYLYMNCYEDGSVHGKVKNTANSNKIEDYFGYWTNINSRGKESLVLHILSYNGGEYNSGMYDIVCDTISGGEYYDFASNIAISKWGNQRTMTINGYRYSPVKSLTVTTTDASSGCIIGDSIVYTGLVVTVNRENGRSIAIDAESYGDSTCRVTFSGFDSSEAGEINVTVSYVNTDVSTTYKVTVMGIKKIELDTQDAVLTYTEGDSLNTAGLVVNATRDDGVVTQVDVSNCTVGWETGEVGTDVPVTVNFRGTTATYYVDIIAISDITLDTTNVKTDYTVGDSLDTSGLVVNATRTDGEVVEIAVSKCTIDYSGVAGDEVPVTVTYRSFTKTYNVKVKALSFSGEITIGEDKKTVSIGVTSGTQLTYSYDTTTLTLNYETLSIASKTVYTLSLPSGDTANEEVFETLPKQYLLNTDDNSIKVALLYTIPSSGSGAGSDRYENEPYYVSGNTEQRYILIDEEAGTATITYKYYYAMNTDTFVCKYTIENGILTLTEEVSKSVGASNATFSKLHKQWKLNDDYTANRTPLVSEE